MKTIIYTILSVLLLFSCRVHKNINDEQQQTVIRDSNTFVFSNNIGRNDVPIAYGHITGTVTYINSGYATSTKHGTGSLNDTIVVKFPKDTLSGIIVYRDGIDDYSLIKLEKIPNESIELYPVYEKNIQSVVSIGYPFIRGNKSYNKRTVIISKIVLQNHGIYFLKDIYYPGFSGAGVFDSNNNIIGIILGGLLHTKEDRKYFKELGLNKNTIVETLVLDIKPIIETIEKLKLQNNITFSGN